jgi:hypothetical protein
VGHQSVKLKARLATLFQVFTAAAAAAAASGLCQVFSLQEFKAGRHSSPFN